ncbi:helix-turn-helix domain-containing protein [Lactiplantibacillus pentosus]|uniref:helix-turn-helix domain-containing protein n=1 Tax=Lactiplantibacillus pentosus TaxID=1589 RepID=UPI002182364A|nr:Rgg/GadR/MutR family transcriptional regulator [Lactiplantibacillus pentosus]MCS8602334.1 Rgg/GadR/MutR family transcriptional regulator [Lactiplantibacillus pentosus]MDC6398279.1 helix-turn-helix domain-containing protein [Lactiplantibacillus pentosus]WFC03663.1 helix-turn-helix domain-containing protein [Lactiplantibacillus pentosus]
MTHGQLIRKLRKERGLTQAQLAEGISSRTTLSTLENNKTDVNINTLFSYLDRLNVSIQEYLFYFNDSSNTEKELATKYFYDNIVKKRDIEIEQRILDYQSKYKDSKDFYYCCLSIELKLFLNKKKDKTVFDVREDTEIIKKYLERVTQWGHFEMSIFANCLYIFTSEYIRATFTILLKRTKILSKIDTYQNDISIFLNNCIVLALERKNYQNARFYIQQLYQISEKTPRKAYDRMMCAYYLALLKQIKGANANVDSTISHFKELGFSEHAEMLENLRDRLLSSSKQSIA